MECFRFRPPEAVTADCCAYFLCLVYRFSGTRKNARSTEVQTSVGRKASKRSTEEQSIQGSKGRSGKNLADGGELAVARPPNVPIKQVQPAPVVPAVEVRDVAKPRPSRERQRGVRAAHRGTFPRRLSHARFWRVPSPSQPALALLRRF